MPSSKRRHRTYTNKRKTQLHRGSRKQMKGGGCGCGKNPLFSGGRRRRRTQRARNQRGGFLTGNYSINPVANFGSSSGAWSNANTLYGASDVNPSPSSQNVSFYNNPHNIRAA